MKYKESWYEDHWSQMDLPTLIGRTSFHFFQILLEYTVQYNTIVHVYLVFQHLIGL